MMFRNGLKVKTSTWFGRTLKDFLLCLFIGAIFAMLMAIFFSGCATVPEKKKSSETMLAGKDLKDSSCLQMYYKKDFVGQLTVKEFKALLDASENYSNLLKAEDNQTVKIELETSPWEIKATDNTFETYANIVWYSDKGSVLKKIRFRIRLNKNNDSWNVSKIDEAYSKASRILFPTTLGTTIILILILIILL